MTPTMLVVDDEPLVRLELVELAQEAGFETVEAATARQAIAILESRNDIQVVFTDIRMPGDMDGLALAHFVRNRWPPTVIVICSGNTQPLPEQLPANVAFLSKPFTGAKVSSLVSSIFAEVSQLAK